MNASRRSAPRWFGFAAVSAVVVVAGAAAFMPRPGVPSPVGVADVTLDPTATAIGTLVPAPGSPAGAAAAASPSALGAASPPPAAGPTFQPIGLGTGPIPLPSDGPVPSGDPGFFRIDLTRPVPAQAADWLAAKAAGRVALLNGRLTVLAAGADPLLRPGTGAPVAPAYALDTTWTRLIVEPPGSGVDEKGNRYTDSSYWNLCGPGAAAVALYYWQALTGYPNVTGTAGYFVDPYASAGVAWPAGGPRFIAPNGVPNRRGTYWSGTDRVSGYTAHGRGFVMYLGMAVRAPGWTDSGIDVFATNGAALYPTRGSSRGSIAAAMNWEASNHDPANWSQWWYTSVSRTDPSLARDLSAAVTLDLGRDHVAVVAAIDTFDLPNWQGATAASTPHTRHAIAIVGYDNGASPPTFTYIDTCGRGCNPRPGNSNGGLHVIAQAQMVKAIQDQAGSGFVW